MCRWPYPVRADGLYTSSLSLASSTPARRLFATCLRSLFQRSHPPWFRWMLSPWRPNSAAAVEECTRHSTCGLGMTCDARRLFGTGYGGGRGINRWRDGETRRATISGARFAGATAGRNGEARLGSRSGAGCGDRLGEFVNRGQHDWLHRRRLGEERPINLTAEVVKLAVGRNHTAGCSQDEHERR